MFCFHIFLAEADSLPNANVQLVGEEVADRDIDECGKMAKNIGATLSQGKRAQVAGSTAAGCALLGEFFVDGLDELVDVEGFFEDATGAKEFRDVEEVAVALRTGHGDHLRVEIFPRQL